MYKIQKCKTIIIIIIIINVLFKLSAVIDTIGSSNSSSPCSQLTPREREVGMYRVPQSRRRAYGQP